jgi:hypothetical protein
MQQPSFMPKQNHPNINKVHNDMDPNNNLGIQRFSHLETQTKHSYLTRITILIPMDMFFESKADVDY